MTDTIFEKIQIEAPTERLKSIVKSLAVSDQTKTAIQSDIDSGAMEGYPVKHVFSDWINSTVLCGVDSDTVQEALDAPDISFMQYARTALKVPYDPAPYVIDVLCEKTSFEFLSSFHMIHWKQELMLLESALMSQDDMTVFYAHTFKTLLQAKGVSAMFDKIAVFAYERADIAQRLSNILYNDEPRSDFSVAILYVQNMLEGQPTLPESRLSRLVRDVRAQAHTRVSTIEKQAVLSELKESPLYYQSSLVHQCVKMKVSSNNLNALFESFLVKINRGEVPLDRAELAMQFLMHITENHMDLNYSLPDRREIITKIASINSIWFKELPQTCAALGGMNKATWSKWRDSIVNGEREAPNNLKLDYFVYLSESQFC